MSHNTIDLASNKKIFFASDFHLGLAGISRKDEIEREKTRKENRKRFKDGKNKKDEGKDEDQA